MGSVRYTSADPRIFLPKFDGAFRKLGRVTEIRPYRPTDRSDVYDICVRTGDGGQDATGLYSTDDLLPDIYALPYLEREPELAFVVDNGTRVVGYILGTADTRAFAEWFSTDWWPRRAAAHTAPSSERERGVIDSAADPDRMLVAAVDDYPAHLHIDLLPEAQGGGFGRRLVETLAGALAKRGVAGLHLVVGTDNTAAQAFYRRVGFTELASDAGGVVMGIRTGA